MIFSVASLLTGSPELNEMARERVEYIRESIMEGTSDKPQRYEGESQEAEAPSTVMVVLLVVGLMLMISFIATVIIISRNHPNLGTFGAVVVAMLFGDLYWYGYFMPRTVFRHLSGKPIAEVINFDSLTANMIHQELAKNGGDYNSALASVLGRETNVQG